MIVYVVRNRVTNSIQYLTECQMEQYQPEFQSGIFEFVEVINTEE